MHGWGEVILFGRARLLWEINKNKAGKVLRGNGREMKCLAMNLPI